MKAAIYCRLSEEDRNKSHKEDDSSSIRNQKTMLLQYALDQGWEVYDIYSDDDYAGADRRRPQFNRLLEDAKARKFDIILCKTQSRFTRELEMVEKYIHGLFPQWGIRFISIVDNGDTAVKGNKKSRQINGLINEWYLEDMSENIRSVLTNRRQNGHHIGSFALYGYRKDPEIKGHLIIDEEAAAVVREVFNLFIQGYGKTAIARILNDRGIPNPTEYKRRQGLRYQHPKASTFWKYPAISAMLTNEIYIGNMVQGKSGSVSYKTKQCRPRPKEQWFVVEGTHQPIIRREIWDQVQTMLSQRAKPFSAGKTGIFARMVRCGYCGCILRSTKNRGRYYLQCQTRHVSKDACIGAFISVAELEQNVIEELNRLSSIYLDVDLLQKSVVFHPNIHHQRDKILQNIAAYQKSIDVLSKDIRTLYLDKLKGFVAEEDYLAISGPLVSQRTHLTNLIATNQQELANVDKRIGEGEDSRNTIAQYMHPDRLSRRMVMHLIDHIVIYRREHTTKSIPMEIYWNF